MLDGAEVGLLGFFLSLENWQLAVAVVFLVSAAFFLFLFVRAVGSLRRLNKPNEMQALDAQLKQAVLDKSIKAVGAAYEGEYLDTLVADYYRTEKHKAMVVFYFSLFASCFGLLVLSYAIFRNISTENPGQLTVPVIVAAISEFVALTFFALQQRAQSSLVQFFDRLREDYKTHRAVSLLDDVEDVNKRDFMRTALFSSLTGVKVPKT